MNQLIKKHLAQYAATPDGQYTVYEVEASSILDVCKFLYKEKSVELKTIFACDQRAQAKRFRIYYVFGLPKEHTFLIPYITIRKGTGFPTLTKYIHEASGYERKIHSMMGLVPIGHPDLRPFILHENWPKTVYPLRKDFPISKKPSFSDDVYAFQTVKGEGIYEIPVGPVHAGIIEPGHFRFSVAGEEIVLLEPKLGYKHRGVEKLFESLTVPVMIRLSERVSGDTSFSHSLAFCQALENLAGIDVSKDARLLRVIYSEMERLANHVNDIGFIMLDTGYSFGGSSGQRLRETIMQWNERLTGNRYLRDVNTTGGVTKHIEKNLQKEFIRYLDLFETDFREVINIASESSSLNNRLEGTGTLSMEIAKDHGVMGVAGRAVGIARDARKDYPYAGYPDIGLTVSLQDGGDVRARFNVRIKEVYVSLAIIKEALTKLTTSNGQNIPSAIHLKKNGIGIGITEGWRGEIVYTVLTDENGRVSRVDVRDPSFLIWPAVAQAGRGNVVPDFPLINKSFNLSYSGHDL